MDVARRRFTGGLIMLGTARDGMKVDVVTADASPLSSLAKAAHLDLLQRFSGHVVVPDAVYLEATHPGFERTYPAAAGRLAAWIDKGSKGGWLEIAETPAGRDFAALRRVSPEAQVKNIGELATFQYIQHYVEGTDRHAMVIYDNGSLMRMFKQAKLEMPDMNVTIETTLAFLEDCERCGLIASRDEVVECIKAGERSFPQHKAVSAVRKGRVSHDLER